jgi:hypothetical protein
LKTRAAKVAERTGADLADVTMVDRADIAEDIVRAKTERRMKEESQLILAKHVPEILNQP